MKAELEVLIDGSEKFAERVFHCEKEDVDYGNFSYRRCRLHRKPYVCRTSERRYMMVVSGDISVIPARNP